MQDILFSLLNQFTFENSILDPNCDGALPNELLQYAAEFIDIQILFPKRYDLIAVLICSYSARIEYIRVDLICPLRVGNHSAGVVQ